MMVSLSPESSLQTNAIELRNISITRRGNAILADVNPTVAAGSCCAILGPNGSGKSALMVVVLSGLIENNGRFAASVQVAKESTSLGGTRGRRVKFNMQTGEIECRFAGDIPRKKRPPEPAT